MIMMQAYQGYGSSSRDSTRAPVALEDAREGIGIRDGRRRRRIGAA
jgi:hypothetical protein